MMVLYKLQEKVPKQIVKKIMLGLNLIPKKIALLFIDEIIMVMYTLMSEIKERFD